MAIIISLKKVYMRKFSGFSLLEVLLGMSLGLMLLAMVITLFLDIQQTNNTVGDQLFLQANMRLALQIIGNDIRTIGYRAYPEPSLASADNLQVIHQVDDNDTVTINGKVIFEIRRSPYPNGKSSNSLFQTVELIPGIDKMHIALLKNHEGKSVAVKIFLHMIAPYGMTMSQQVIFALREVRP
jgi:type II secretory pathway pseudopilin PulG